jgi:transposase
MGRVNTPILSESAKLALEQGLKTGKTHTFRTRCQVILLKSTGRNSKEVGEITGMTYVSVNSWVKRYKDLGIDGLQTQAGRGPKRKLSKETDKESILESIKAHRQRIQTAKAEWEQKSGKSVSLSTLKSFLKALTVDINE